MLSKVESKNLTFIFNDKNESIKSTCLFQWKMSTQNKLEPQNIYFTQICLINEKRSLYFRVWFIYNSLKNDNQHISKYGGANAANNW